MIRSKRAKVMRCCQKQWTWAPDGGDNHQSKCFPMHTPRREVARTHILPLSFSSQGLVDLARESEWTSCRGAKVVRRRTEGQLKDQTVFPPGSTVSSEPASHLHCSATPVVTGISRPSPGRHGNRSSSKNAGSMAARSARMTRRGILYHPKLLVALHCWAAPVAASISRPSANGHRYSCKHAGLAAARRPHDLTLACRLALLSCCRRAICSRAPS